MGNEIAEAIRELITTLEDIKGEIHALRRAVERDRK
jgi:hypothetical protein